MDSLFYVYTHLRISDNKVFYVGKGSKERAYNKSDRSTHWKNTVSKHGIRIEIVADCLLEQDAFELEKELLTFYKLINLPLTNLKDGGKGGMSGCVFTQETRNKMSLSRKGIKRPQHVVDTVAKANARNFTIVSPTGSVIRGFNMTAFAREHKLDPRNLHAVITGKDRSYKGYTKYVEPTV